MPSLVRLSTSGSRNSNRPKHKHRAKLTLSKTLLIPCQISIRIVISRRCGVTIRAHSEGIRSQYNNNAERDASFCLNTSLAHVQGSGLGMYVFIWVEEDVTLYMPHQFSMDGLGFFIFIPLPLPLQHCFDVVLLPFLLL